jgi:hypothetical protein
MQTETVTDVPVEIMATGQRVEIWLGAGAAARIVGVHRDHLARLRRRGLLGPDAVQRVGPDRYRYSVSGLRRALAAPRR